MERLGLGGALREGRRHEVEVGLEHLALRIAERERLAARHDPVERLAELVDPRAVVEDGCEGGRRARPIERHVTALRGPLARRRREHLDRERPVLREHRREDHRAIDVELVRVRLLGGRCLREHLGQRREKTGKIACHNALLAGREHVDEELERGGAAGAKLRELLREHDEPRPRAFELLDHVPVLERLHEVRPLEPERDRRDDLVVRAVLRAPHFVGRGGERLRDSVTRGHVLKRDEREAGRGLHRPRRRGLGGLDHRARLRAAVQSHQEIGATERIAGGERGELLERRELVRDPLGALFVVVRGRPREGAPGSREGELCTRGLVGEDVEVREIEVVRCARGGLVVAHQLVEQCGDFSP